MISEIYQKLGLKQEPIDERLPGKMIFYKSWKNI